MPLSPNTRLGRYEIRLLLGAGGMGEVYLALDTKLGRAVALKILPIELATDQAQMGRFVQEAKAASALNHPNIITIYEIEHVASTHFIATEFINGETLRKYMSRARILFPEALDICMQTASALAAAHEAGIIHRDIKPDNIMLRRDGIVKVLDFGLAKIAERAVNRIEAEAETKPLFHTEPGTVMGTVEYMSPEQARGLEVDARTDIWSLGVVLYEMVAGRQPFVGGNTADIVVAILTSPPPPLVDFDQDVSSRLQRIASRALEKDRTQRYENVQELLNDLSELKKDFGSNLDRPQVFSARAGIAQDSFTRSFDVSRLRINEEILSSSLRTANSKAIPYLPPNNLAPRRTSIVGREIEIQKICSELRRENVRLLTLTGVGGTGKTTLAHAVAERMLPEFRDGVFFIEMSAIKQPELVASTIAQQLGVKEAEGKSILERLKDYLQQRKLLLAVDNFEQVVAAGSVIAELLAAAPQTKVLVTSRALLHLSFENEYLVPPLALPETVAQVSPAELRRYEAVTLFIERARSVKSSFNLTEENANSVAEICARLDGLPLAIELAAARVKVLSPQAILSRLDNRLQLLTGGARDLPTRQQTMRGAVDWSYELLPEDEKQLFRRLGVFAGGFTIEAAEAVVGAELSPALNETINQEKTVAPGAETGDLLDGITSLVDKNLLIAKEQAGGESRFRMLEIVREFALERLEANGETEAMQRKHAAYFLAFAEEAEPQLQGAQPARWLNLLEQEHANIGAALRRCLEFDPATAGRLAAAIRYFWDFQGYLTEGLKFSKDILKLGDRVPRSARWKLLSMAGNMAKFQGNYEAARSKYEEGLIEGRAAHDLPQIALSCRGLAGLALSQGNYGTARIFIDEALQLAREANDKFGIARSLNMLGDLARSLGEDAAARPLHEEALEICRQLGNKFAAANILNNLAAAEYSDGDYASAHSHFAEGLNLARESGDKIAGDKIAISYSLDGFAALAVERGESELAAKLAGAAERVREKINFNISEPAERRFRDACLRFLHDMLPEDAFTEAYAQGRKLKLEDAIRLALGDK
jgi:non-specific serine/threonine protein kinase